MPEKDFIINKTRCLLNEFIEPIAQKADKPRKKFLHQAIGAILLSGSLVVTEFGRWIHDDCSDIFYRLKRLLNHLISPRGDLTLVVNAYRKSVSRYIQHDTPIIIDLTDLAKPRARNPRANVEVYVPARRKVHFKAGKILRDVLKQEWQE